MNKIIMQGTPSDINLDSIRKYLMEIPEISDFHDLHVWTMDGEYHVLTVHLVMKQTLAKEEGIELKSKIRSDLQSQGIAHTTLEFESEDEDCLLLEC